MESLDPYLETFEKSYLKVVLFKIVTALKEEIDNRHWRVDVNDDGIILVERIVDETFDLSREDARDDDQALDFLEEFNSSADAADAADAFDSDSERNSTERRRWTLPVSMKRKRGRPRKKDSTPLTMFEEGDVKFPVDLSLATRLDGADGFLCNVCGAAFPTKQSLRRHAAKAHDSRTWPCKICGKHFNNGKHARRHELSVHLRKTKLDCPVCGKTCSTKENLGRHIRSIHEKKKVLCEVCGKGFTAAHSMKIHVDLVHLRKRVPCTFCGKEMSEIHLRRHVRSVHQGVRHSCQFCSKSFDRPYRLKKHMASVHGAKDDAVKDDNTSVSTWLNLPTAEVVGSAVEMVAADLLFQEEPVA